MTAESRVGPLLGAGVAMEHSIGFHFLSIYVLCTRFYLITLGHVSLFLISGTSR